LAVSGPKLLNSAHRVDGFSCGKPRLDAWLDGYVSSDHRRGLTKVFVVCDGTNVVGFYGIAPTVVAPNLVTRAVLPAPNPISCLLIGQLGVDLRYQKRRVGTALVNDAFKRCLASADTIGASALIVRAIDFESRRYWLTWGFTPLLGNMSILVQPLANLKHANAPGS